MEYRCDTGDNLRCLFWQEHAGSELKRDDFRS
jgi:hypothetical protein